MRQYALSLMLFVTAPVQQQQQQQSAASSGKQQKAASSSGDGGKQQQSARMSRVQVACKQQHGLNLEQSNCHPLGVHFVTTDIGFE